MTRAEVLTRYGIIDGPNLIVEAVQEGGTLWRVSIHAAGNPATALVPKEALKLADKLRRSGEEKLADRIAQESDKARRYQGGDARK